MNLLELIPNGYENRVTTAYLIGATGLRERTLREHIRLLIKQGADIRTTRCCGGGYWVSDDKEEMRQHSHTLKSVAFDMLDTARKIDKRVAEYEGQEALDLGIENG